jgi:hypothetical protein
MRTSGRWKNIWLLTTSLLNRLEDNSHNYEDKSPYLDSIVRFAHLILDETRWIALSWSAIFCTDFFISRTRTGVLDLRSSSWANHVVFKRVVLTILLIPPLLSRLLRSRMGYNDAFWKIDPLPWVWHCIHDYLAIRWRNSKKCRSMVFRVLAMVATTRRNRLLVTWPSCRRGNFERTDPLLPSFWVNRRNVWWASTFFSSRGDLWPVDHVLLLI